MTQMHLFENKNLTITVKNLTVEAYWMAPGLHESPTPGYWRAWIIKDGKRLSWYVDFETEDELRQWVRSSAALSQASR